MGMVNGGITGDTLPCILDPSRLPLKIHFGGNYGPFPFNVKCNVGWNRD